jgi:PKD repeat protein
MTITVMPVPTPQFEAVPPTQIFNASGNPVTFTNTTNAGTWTYQWSFGDGATASDQNPVHTYTALGTYEVTLVVSNANCTDSVMHEVRVLPPPPVADFDSIPSGCEPVAVTFSNTSTNTDVPGTSYRWDFGDGSYSTSENPDYTWFDEGSYRVELTVTGPGGTDTKSQVVHVYPSPRAYFEVSPKVVFVNDERVRCFNHSEDADSYLWEFGDGDTSKLEEPFHKYMDEGTFDITLWVYSDNGCTDKFVLTPAVEVQPAGELRFATVFQPNLDGPVDIDKIPEGGDEVDQFFYPPIREKVIKYKLQIFNRLGVLIFHSDDINKPWNGYYKNKLCPQGVYVWYVEGKYANGEPFKKVGDVTLLH